MQRRASVAGLIIFSHTSHEVMVSSMLFVLTMLSSKATVTPKRCQGGNLSCKLIAPTGETLDESDDIRRNVRLRVSVSLSNALSDVLRGSDWLPELFLPRDAPKERLGS